MNGRIVLVEDDATDAELAIRALRKRKLANPIDHYKDGEEALARLLADGAAPPQIVLLDLKLPKVDGLEVLARLRSEARTRTVPVVILTSSAEEPDIRRGYDLGANSYIVKPVDFEKFSEAVGQLGLYWLVLNEARP